LINLTRDQIWAIICYTEEVEDLNELNDVLYAYWLYMIEDEKAEISLKKILTSEPN
jgi:hypothetical protein